MSGFDWFLVGNVSGFLVGTFLIRVAIRAGVVHSQSNCPAAKDPHKVTREDLRR